MELFDKIKSQYRIYQIGDNFYIQKKTTLGWSYYVSDSSNPQDIPTWFGLLLLILAISSILTIAAGIATIFSKDWTFFLYSGCFTIFYFSLMYFISMKSKSMALNSYSLRSANEKLDDVVRYEISLLQKEKEKEKKEKKYHYFYTEKQVRAEKLKKINKL